MVKYRRRVNVRPSLHVCRLTRQLHPTIPSTIEPSSMAPNPNPPVILQPPPSAPDTSTRATSPNPPSTTRTGIVVFSGGSAANSLVDVFERVREANKTSLSYVIPISDNGGSTSEIIRVFGGPGMTLPSMRTRNRQNSTHLTRHAHRHRRCALTTREADPGQ